MAAICQTVSFARVSTTTSAPNATKRVDRCVSRARDDATRGERHARACGGVSTSSRGARRGRTQSSFSRLARIATHRVVMRPRMDDDARRRRRRPTMRATTTCASGEYYASRVRRVCRSIASSRTRRTGSTTGSSDARSRGKPRVGRGWEALSIREGGARGGARGVGTSFCGW